MQRGRSSHSCVDHLTGIAEVHALRFCDPIPGNVDAEPNMSDSERALDRLHFSAFGFVVLRNAVDASRLSDELDRAVGTSPATLLETGVARAEYAPMMAAITPYSLSLLDRFQETATMLLGARTVPLRAKGVRYFGSTSWHADSLDAVVASIGFAAYLEPLRADTGALRVVPGSHRAEVRGDVLRYVTARGEAALDSLPAVAIATQPGDVIVFDEHLVHASAGGTVRRQWRVDYFRDPTSQAEEAAVRAYIARVFPPDWDGGYDVERFPSYGPGWLESPRPAVARLRELGAYELASAQETKFCSRAVTNGS